MIYLKDFNLRKYNAFRLDSIAKEIWFPENDEELIILITKLKGLKFEILAGGTNTLLNNIINRVICLNRIRPFLSTLNASNRISTNNSCSMIKFVNEVISQGLAGVEGLIGIPGTVGGAITMNSGSGNFAISDYLIEAITINLAGEIKNYKKEQLQFKRRYSILQDNHEILLYALFEFKKAKIDQTIINRVKKYRKFFPIGYSLGGFFVNHYDLKPYEKPIRGIESPNLTISKYLNVVINNGKASTKETLSFINQIKNVVKKPLKLEIKLLGFENE